MKEKYNGGSGLVNVQVINTSYMLKCLQNENDKNATYIQHRELWISDYESWLWSGCTSQSYRCRKYRSFCTTKITHVNGWPLRGVVPVRLFSASQGDCVPGSRLSDNNALGQSFSNFVLGKVWVSFPHTRRMLRRIGQLTGFVKWQRRGIGILATHWKFRVTGPWFRSIPYSDYWLMLSLSPRQLEFHTWSEL